MAEITGPISTLPGARHDLPEGAKCDLHPDRDAVARIQGETDSFGSELHDCCEQCLNEEREYANSAEARTGECEWCKSDVTDLRETRDYDEGLNGRVYSVCGECRRIRDEDAAELSLNYLYDDESI